MSRRFQFSIRFLLVATVAVAAGVAATRAEPAMQSTIAVDCLTLLYATAALLGVAKASGNLRAFWIGTALVLVGVAIHKLDGIMAGLSPFGRPYQSYSSSWKVWCAAAVNGLFAAFVHWLFSPRKEDGE